MFDYRKFLMLGFKSAIGKIADHQVIFNANGFFEKGVFLEEDLAAIEQLIKEKNAEAEKAYIIDENLDIFEEPPVLEEINSEDITTETPEEV